MSGFYMEERNMIKTWFRCFSILFLAFFIFGFTVESQKARDSFVDKKFPESLNRFANEQFYEKLNRQRIVKRLKEDQYKSRQLLRIALIDTGVEPFHPNLIDQIDFNFEDKKGRLRMGKDIMGQDYFASSNLIDPSVFAFGAKLQGPLIEQYVENPLGLMKKMNDRFLNILITEMNSNPQFENTLFRDKFTRDSMNIFGAYSLLMPSSDDPKYQEKKGTLIKGKRNYAIKDKESGKYLYNAKEIHNIYDRPWFVNSETGLMGFVQGTSNLVLIEKGFEFLELISESFQKVNNELKVIDAMKSYKEFVEKRSNGNSLSLSEFIRDLSRMLYYKNYGVNSFHPIRDWVANIYDSLISDPEKEQRILTEKFTVKPNELFKMVEYGFKKSEEVYQFLEKNVDSLEKGIEAPQLVVEQLKVLAELFKGYRKNASKNVKFNLVDLLSPHATVPFSSESRRQYFFAYHPYIAKSSKNSHGTHVALTGSVQNKNLRVFPIRVITSPAYLSPEQQKEMKSIFKVDFKKWLKLPLVIKGLKERFGDVIDFSSKSHGVESLMSLLNTTIDLSFKREILRYTASSELIEAIKEVGKQKIKLVNISLGGEFSNHVSSQFKESVEERVSNSYRFLLYEYYKFRIGETILKHAQQTLFIVAAGNEGRWTDGQSRSTLPGNISSLWLAEHETSKKDVAPNNRVNNILTVGSLDRKGKALSPFTNIPVYTRNLIFARGETVLAAGVAYDSLIMQEIMEHALPGAVNRASTLDLNEDLIKQFLVKKGYLTRQEASDSRKFHSQKRLFENYIRVSHDTLKIQTVHLLNKYRPNTMSMTGTSMAAPSVWGYIANFVQKEMVKRGLSSEEVWFHKDFSPKELIREVKSRTVGLGGYSKSPYRLLPEKEINRVKRDKGGAAIMKYIQIQQEKVKAANEVLFTSALKRKVITCKSFL